MDEQDSEAARAELGGIPDHDAHVMTWGPSVGLGPPAWVCPECLRGRHWPCRPALLARVAALTAALEAADALQERLRERSDADGECLICMAVYRVGAADTVYHYSDCEAEVLRAQLDAGVLVGAREGDPNGGAAPASDQGARERAVVEAARQFVGYRARLLARGEDTDEGLEAAYCDLVAALSTGRMGQ